MSEYYVFTKKRDEANGWMNGCIVWWCPGGKGYTYDMNRAGVFTDEDRAKGYPSERNCTYVPKELADQLAYSPRLLWWRHPDHVSISDKMPMPAPEVTQ